MSESEEMYLITIARFEEEGLASPVPLSKLAEKLSVAPVSVNQMVKKLEEAALVQYLPYKGVALTSEGRRLARRVLRHRRLWEYFLVKKLNLSLPEADALACRMEHITTADLAERLADFLRHPARSAQGLPIPPGDADFNWEPAQPMHELQIGHPGEVVQVVGSTTTASFLETEGLQSGSQVTVLAVGGDGALLIQVNDHRIRMTRSLAEMVLVRNLG